MAKAPASGRAMTSLDPFDLRTGVVAVDAQVPGVADDARGDPDGRVFHAHAGERGGVGLAPLLAVVQGVGVALAEAGEGAGAAAFDRIVRTEVEEDAVLALHPLLGLHGSMLGGLGGRGGGGACAPRVEGGRLLGAWFFQAGGLELRE